MNQQPINLELVYTIFSEDVRFEASNHLSLMGVTHQIVVPRLPVTMIKLAVLNHWRTKEPWLGEDQYLTEVRILTPDRTQVIAASQPTAFAVPPDGYADNVTVFVNTTFFQPGEHVVQTLVNSSLFAEQKLPVLLIEQQQPVMHSEHIN